MAVQRDLTPILAAAAQESPSITLTGPRQSGKTTLSRAVFPQHSYVSLEAPDVRAFASEDPRAFLSQYPDGAIIDEVQRVPELLSYLQGIIDEDPQPGRWVLTGSQNLSLSESVSQSLAGRTAVHHLLPLARSEVMRFAQHPETLEEAVFAGGYPRIFDEALDPSEWLRSYVATYIERDVRAISQVGDLTTFQRFVELCAGRTSQLVNYSSLASDCGVSQPTARAWLGILEASFIVFRLPPFPQEPGQAAGEDAEAALLRYRPRLLADRHPDAGAASHSPSARPHIRDMGGLGGRQASHERGREEGPLLLSEPGRG